MSCKWLSKIQSCIFQSNFKKIVQRYFLKKKTKIEGLVLKGTPKRKQCLKCLVIFACYYTTYYTANMAVISNAKEKFEQL